MTDKQKSLEYHIAALHLRRALRKVLRARAFLSVVVLPPNTDSADWLAAANDTIAFERGVSHIRSRKTGVDSITSLADVELGLDSSIRGELRTVVLVTAALAEKALSHPSMPAADAIIDVSALLPHLIQRAIHEVGKHCSLREAEELAAMTPSRRSLVVRSVRPISAILGRLRAAAVKAAAVADALAKSVADVGVRLEDLHGYGAAKDWGLELSRDIADYRDGVIGWGDVDAGLLLSGPPGSGKTTYAAALARTCDIPLVTGSYAKWQAAGHQGDMLKAMRLAFSLARKTAPCVFLIDEIDGFIDRDAGVDSSYLRGVVNGLLEELDGSEGRDGVVVIGACNNPSILDPALRRPGRLDRHIEIGLPDPAARKHILSRHLQSDIDLRPFLRRTEGMSGADLERVARDARRHARRERVAVCHVHIDASLPVRARRSDEALRLIATHEIGHAVVGAVLGAERLSAVYIEAEYDPAVDASVAGGAVFRTDPQAVRNSRYYADTIATLLAGMTSEHMAYGSHTHGVIVDLAQATATATLILASVGMGSTISSSGHRDPGDLARARDNDPLLARRVEELLQEQAVRARAILEEHREAVEELVELLIANGRISGRRVYEVVARPRSQLSLAV